MTGQGVVAVRTEHAPGPAGHYSQATIAGGLVFVSGQLPIAPDGTILADAPFEMQAARALDNVLAIVAAAGGGPAQIARVTAYVVGVEHWAQFDRVYAQRLGGCRPARAVVPVPELHHGVLVEIEAIAWVAGATAPA